VALPPSRPDIERVSSLRVLGVILNDKLTAADHLTALLSSGSSMLYAMRVLRSHGTPTTSLQDIFCATVISRILSHDPVRGTIVVWYEFRQGRISPPGNQEISRWAPAKLQNFEAAN